MAAVAVAVVRFRLKFCFSTCWFVWQSIHHFVALSLPDRVRVRVSSRVWVFRSRRLSGPLDLSSPLASCASSARASSLWRCPLIIYFYMFNREEKNWWAAHSMTRNKRVVVQQKINQSITIYPSCWKLQKKTTTSHLNNYSTI